MAQYYNTYITDSGNLIFYLDAVNLKSYSGSGSIWYDVSGNSNHFTLFNSPTYTNNGTTGTYLTFNGTNQYARSTNAINFNQYSAVTIEIGYRSTVTNTTQILYETTGTGGSTATGGITLLMNANSTSTAANTYLSQWQGYGPRLFGFTVNTNSSFNSVVETFVKGSDSTGRQVYVNGTVAQFFTNTAVTVLTPATTTGLAFANTWTFVASRAGTNNFFRGDIAYIRAWGKKLDTNNIITNSISTVARQSSSYQTPTLLTADPTITPPGLYNFTSFTFTTAGTVGPTGPSLATLLASYDTVTNSWLNNTAYFNAVSGIQRWTVPRSANYRITAAGSVSATRKTSGRGVIFRGDFSLTQGQVIYILCGQQDLQTPTVTPTGGGGGTFVVASPYNTNASILVVAGGGGGAHDGATGYSQSTADASFTTSGNSGTPSGQAGGTAGGGGFWPSGSGASAGSGFSGTAQGRTGSEGADGSLPQSFISGGAGGGIGGTSSTKGGFGGGGFTWYQSGWGGGGGGYSGGGTGSNNNYNGNAGGGGSYNNGTNQVQVGTNNASGYVTIEVL